MSIPSGGERKNTLQKKSPADGGAELRGLTWK
jgi:hypothetical protein